VHKTPAKGRSSKSIHHGRALRSFVKVGMASSLAPTGRRIACVTLGAPDPSRSAGEHCGCARSAAGCCSRWLGSGVLRLINKVRRAANAACRTRFPRPGSDGSAGTTVDLLFDDTNWRMRRLQESPGTWRPPSPGSTCRTACLGARPTLDTRVRRATCNTTMPLCRETFCRGDDAGAGSGHPRPEIQTA